MHGQLEGERAAIVALFPGVGEIDRSHRKLAHRSSRLDLVHVFRAHGAPGAGRRRSRPAWQPTASRSPAPRGRTGWNGSPIESGTCDFTHFTRARRATPAIIDVVSRRPITTLLSAEESSVQVEVGFTAALSTEDLLDAADAVTTQQRCAPRCWVVTATGSRSSPSMGPCHCYWRSCDNGPQMRSVSTREFLAGVAIAQQFALPAHPRGPSRNNSRPLDVEGP